MKSRGVVVQIFYSATVEHVEVQKIDSSSTVWVQKPGFG